ncbi:cytochrome P450 [Krasilnikovia sp. MM14-A1259]|uniref:cytochrome P450 n=1 Tax=Krasilnikovia sp. MM14-A1259 TaxID=3373539 RepID=UPI0038292D65
MTGPLASAVLPEGLRWDADRGRLKVRDPRLADIVLRDPHIITGVDHGKSARAGALPPPGESPTITQFFELWYTVGEHYPRFNTELRRAFTARVVGAFDTAFRDEADRCVAAMPPHGDLARDYLSPYFMHSTFLLIGVPPEQWPRLTKVARLVIHLFKQQLLGVTEYGEKQAAAFATAMHYLKRLTDQMLTGPGEEPFLLAARDLATIDASTWPIAALVGQLLMAGIEPMIVGSSIACRDIWSAPHLRDAIRDATVDVTDLAEEVLRQHPPFGNIFRFVTEPCDCLGVPLPAGTIVAIDVAAVNLHRTPAADPARGCPVRPSEVLTFGRGTHYCLGAYSARIQVAAGLRQLVRGRADLRLDLAGTRIDTHNNLKEVRAIPYRIGGGDAR